MVRQPVIGACLTLLGAVFLVGAVSKGSIEAGQMVAGLIVSLIFLLTGYVLVAYRDAFSVDTATARWRQTKGIVPFLRHASGSLSAARGLRLCRETRTAIGTQANWDYDVWAARIVWQDPSLAPLNLDALDMPCDYVEYDQAATACLRYGTTIGLPLLEADEASAEKNDAQDAF